MVSRVTGRQMLPDHTSMVDFGRDLAASLRAGDVILLHGDLGAGKTTLVQGIAAGLGVVESIQSPTFGLVSDHEGWVAGGTPLTIHHLDLYRLESPEELEDLGYDQYLAPVDGVSLIEWPERAGNWLPDRFILIRISMAPAGGRVVDVALHGETSASTNE